MDPESVQAGGRVPHDGTTGPTILDFNANTNPRRPDGVEAVYREVFDASTRYLDDDYADFRAAVGDYVGCVPEAAVPTAGGLEALRFAPEVTLSPGDTTLVPEPNFGEYDHEIRLQGAEPVTVTHDAILDADPADHAVAVVRTSSNPTGELTPTGDLRAFAARCHKADTILAVDEAFLDFTDEPNLTDEPDVVVARSLTKMFGLPGIRVGFAATIGDLGDRLAVARRTWSLSTPAAAVGAYCMGDTEFISRARARVSAERKRFRETLSDAFAVFPSDAPFLLMDVDDHDVDAVVETACDRGVAVRDATTFPMLDSYARVAVKHPDENDELLRALATIADNV